MIKLSIWDEEAINNDLVGEATIKLSDLIATGRGNGAWLDIYYENEIAG